MKVLSVKQPYAFLLCAGIKPYENRTWALPKSIIGERVLIHASGVPPKKISKKNQKHEMRAMPKNIDYRKLERDYIENYHLILSMPDPSDITGAIIGSLIFTGQEIAADNPWAEKNKAKWVGEKASLFEEWNGEKLIRNWKAEDPVLFNEPILNVKGRLNFWNYDEIESQDIICPSCGSIEHAIVDLRLPWNTFLHDCRKCGHTIMQSEWEQVKNKR